MDEFMNWVQQAAPHTYGPGWPAWLAAHPMPPDPDLEADLYGPPPPPAIAAANAAALAAPVAPVPPPPRPWPQRNIPPDTNDLVNQYPITEGMDMVDFHGEYGYGRYYPVDVYDALHLPKLNPMTRRPILPGDLQYYTAHIAESIGGRRRRRHTKKGKRRVRKTRRSHK